MKPSPVISISITPARLALALTLVAALAWAANTSIDYGNRLIKGSLTVDKDVSMGSVLSPSVLDAGLVKADLIDAGNINVQGNVGIAGKVPVLRADVVDAGQLFVQGFGPVTRIVPFTTAAIDFASTTTTCNDSAAQTATGARTTDPCFVGTGTSGSSANASYTCYVSATDAVKIRHCAAGTADDPASQTFTGFVISGAQ